MPGLAPRLSPAMDRKPAVPAAAGFPGRHEGRSGQPARRPWGADLATSDLRETEAMARVFLRPMGSPLPLGFAALAAGTFTVAGLQLSWIPASQWHLIGLVLLTFVVPLQALGCVYGFLARDSAAGTGVAIQGGGWFSIGLVTFVSRPGQTSPALGLILIGAASALLIPMVTSAYSKLLASAVMGATALRFYLTAAYELAGSAAWKEAAGVAGLILAVLALYAALAFELEDTRRATILPTLRRPSGRLALAGRLAEEITAIHHEAGVRRVL